MKKYWLLGVLCVWIIPKSFAQLCGNEGRFTNAPYFEIDQIRSQTNIVYGQALNWKDSLEQLTLDVYYPALQEDVMQARPFILMVHGGGLIAGDKTNYSRACVEFARRGFVAASLNYRLGLNCAVDSIAEEKAKYRAQQDVHAALRFIVSRADELRIDTTWMFIGGGSAGAVAALGVVYLSQEEWNTFTPGIESLLGQLNRSGNTLTNSFRLRGVFNDWGAMLKDVLEPHELLPMVSFHGDADPTVAIDSAFGGGCIQVEKTYGSRALHQVLIENGICSDLSVKPGGGHGVYETDDDAGGISFRVGRAACFFRGLFCNTCTSNYQTNATPASCSLTTQALEELNATRVYPNPFQEQLQIMNLPHDAYVRLTNSVGKTVIESSEWNPQVVAHLEAGLYFLNITTPSNRFVYKLTKVN